MHRLLKKEQILTVPNLLSLVRLLLIPLILWLYLAKAEYLLAVAVIALSGATDILDGYIARRCRMVSDLGKIIDPVADKLTQAAMFFCLLNRYRAVRWLLALFIVKEFIMAFFGWLIIRKKDSVNSAQWFGKATTVTLYGSMVILFLFPTIPEVYADTLFALCAALIVLSLVKYLAFYRKILADGKTICALGSNVPPSDPNDPMPADIAQTP